MVFMIIDNQKKNVQFTDFEIRFLIHRYLSSQLPIKLFSIAFSALCITSRLPLKQICNFNPIQSMVTKPHIHPIILINAPRNCFQNYCVGRYVSVINYDMDVS